MKERRYSKLTGVTLRTVLAIGIGAATFSCRQPETPVAPPTPAAKVELLVTPSPEVKVPSKTPTPQPSPTPTEAPKPSPTVEVRKEECGLEEKLGSAMEELSSVDPLKAARGDEMNYGVGKRYKEMSLALLEEAKKASSAWLNSALFSSIT